MKAKEIVYKYRGGVERPCLDSRGRPAYRWTSGYSEDGETGVVLFPWMTYRECQAEAKARGGKAVFFDERKER